MDMETIVLLIVGASALVMAGVKRRFYREIKPANVGGMLESTGAALTGIETARIQRREYAPLLLTLWKTGKIAGFVPIASIGCWIAWWRAFPYPEETLSTR